jgi:hypothetical protein
VKIDDLIGSINENNRCLNTLLKEKSQVTEQIQTVLDFHAYSKAPLNENQMDLFADFTGFYSENAESLQQTLLEINSQKVLKATKRELLHNNVNYSKIIDELRAFNEMLVNAIGCLKNIIERGYMTLQVL